MRTNDFFEGTLLPLVKNNSLTQTMRYSDYLKRFIEKEDRTLSRYM